VSAQLHEALQSTSQLHATGGSRRSHEKAGPKKDDSNPDDVAKKEIQPQITIVTADQIG